MTRDELLDISYNIIVRKGLGDKITHASLSILHEILSKASGLSKEKNQVTFVIQHVLTQHPFSSLNKRFCFYFLLDYTSSHSNKNSAFPKEFKIVADLFVKFENHKILFVEAANLLFPEHLGRELQYLASS